MRVREIASNNYKGRDIRRSLTGCDLLTGPMDSQKTATLDVFQLALLGKTTGSLLKQLTAVHREFATDPEKLIQTMFTLDNDVFIKRAFGPDKSGKVGQAVSISGKKIKAQAAKVEIERAFKPCIKGLAFDDEKEGFVYETAPNQLKYLLSLIGDEEGPTVQGIKRKFADVVGAGNDDLLAEIFGPIKAMNISGPDILTALKQRISELKAEAHTQVRSSIAVEDELSSIEENVNRLAGDVTQSARNVEEARKRQKELNSIISIEEKKAMSHEVWANEIDRIKANIENDRTKIGLHADAREAFGIIQTIKMHRDKIRGDEFYSQLRTETGDLEIKLQSLDNDKKAAENDAAALKNSIELYEKTIDAFSVDKVKCPLICTKDAGCPLRKTQRADLVSEHEAALKELRPQHKAADDKFKALLSERNGAAAKLAEAEKQIADAEKEDSEIRAGMKTLEARKKTPIEMGKLIGKSIAFNRASLTKHIAAEPHSDGVADTAAMRDELAGLEASIIKLDADYQAKLEEKGRAVAAMESERKRLKSEARVEVLQKLLVETKSMISNLLAQTIVPICDQISEYLPNAAAYAEIDGKGVFRIGIMKDDIFRSLYSLSQGERTMFIAAMAIALSNLEGSRLRVILAELDTLDKATLPKFLELMSKAVRDGKIDNFIGAINDRGDAPEIEGLNIIKTS